MNLSPAVLGFMRGLGVAIVVAVLTYLGDAANLNGLVSPTLAALIAAIALAAEHGIQAKTGNALFGAVKRS